jgi:DNA helicase II / ATP-dependent DNA helicase PcrA
VYNLSFLRRRGDILSIDKEELRYEKEKLSETRQWVEKEVSNIQSNNEELKGKVAALKKASRGSYNEELETSQRLLEITNKNLDNYNEANKQPYFARIDFREYRREKESFYIGKFGLGDSQTGEEVVIDWRAPLADLYYSGTQGEAYYTAPVGIINGELSLKRKFLFRSAQLQDAFDEGINEIIIKSGLGDGNALIDEYLRINLEESISSKLKDVVATIQKEQNYIIRADKNQPIIVQGSAGSGKTTVALHRLAYLLYRYKNKIKGEDILVVAPNKLFLDYISEVLPNLGVDSVKQKTFEEIAVDILGVKGKIYSKDKKLSYILEEASSEEEVKYITNSSKIKGTMVYKTMMDRYLKIIERKDRDIEDIKVEDYTLFEASEIRRLYDKDLVNLPINKRKDEIKRYLSLKINDKINDIMNRIDFSYEYQIARVKKTMEDGTERRSKFIGLYSQRDDKKAYLRQKSRDDFEDYFKRWKGIDSRDLYFNIYQNDELFEEISGGMIPGSLMGFMKQEVCEKREKEIIDSDDLSAMLYLKIRIEGLEEKYKFQHVVVDEAQDYSMMQLYVIRELASNQSLTIVGDLGQGIYYYKGINDWEKLIKDVFDSEASYMPLTQSYRSTVEIIEFANEVLKKQKNNLKPAVPVLRHGMKPEIIEFKSSKEFSQRIDSIIEHVHSVGKSSVAVIGRTYKECKKIREFLKKYSGYQWELVKDTDNKLNFKNMIVPSYMTKGLEFDCVVVYDCSEESYKNTEIDKKLLYVVLTRALHMEYIFFNGKLSVLCEDWKQHSNNIHNNCKQ